MFTQEALKELMNSMRKTLQARDEAEQLMTTAYDGRDTDGDYAILTGPIYTEELEAPAAGPTVNIEVAITSIFVDLCEPDGIWYFTIARPRMDIFEHADTVQTCMNNYTRFTSVHLIRDAELYVFVSPHFDGIATVGRAFGVAEEDIDFLEA